MQTKENLNERNETTKYTTPVESGLSPLSAGSLHGRSQRVTIPDAVKIQF
jgi:hypothetical protein